MFALPVRFAGVCSCSQVQLLLVLFYLFPLSQTELFLDLRVLELLSFPLLHLSSPIIS